MKNTGFTRYRNSKREDTIWSHYHTGKPTRLRLFKLGSPAGANLYSSITDWSKFIMDQLNGAKGKQGLLKPYSYTKIQTLPKENSCYAPGWKVDKNTISHSGSDYLNLAGVMIYPQKNYSILYCTNIGFDYTKYKDDKELPPILSACSELCAKIGKNYERQQMTDW